MQYVLCVTTNEISAKCLLKELANLDLVDRIKDVPRPDISDVEYRFFYLRGERGERCAFYVIGEHLALEEASRAEFFCKGFLARYER